MKILKFNEGWKNSLMKDRINSYLRMAEIKYPTLTSDEIIEIIENGNTELRFNSDKEKNKIKILCKIF